MTKNMKWLSLLSMGVILLVIPIYALYEPQIQAEKKDEFHISSVVSATDIYATNCAVCHGASGEGISTNPPLNSDAIRSMPEDELIKVISRGRYETQMGAWAVEEGGILSLTQIKDMVTFVQYANWEYVDQRVAELGLTPPEMIEFEVSEEMLSVVSSLPGGENLGLGLVVYAENCAACHGANGSGTVIAPAIDSVDLRAKSSEELFELVSTGVPATLMAAWQGMLPEEEINLVIDLIYRWPEMLEAGVDFPEVELASIPSTPEMIAEGDDLFHLACKSCHGVSAFGTPMAPALNNEIFLSQTPDAAIYQIIAGGVSETLMPAWGSRLNDYDLQTLVAYLRSLEVNAPPIVDPVITN
ncbi:MAG: c-type cytochrome [Chloroflexota bacterium]